MNCIQGDRLVRSFADLDLLLVMLLPLHAENSIFRVVDACSMTPAACSFDSSRQKQTKCLRLFSYYQAYCRSSFKSIVPLKTSAKLSPYKLKVVARVMPDEMQHVHNSWANVGGYIDECQSIF